MNYEIKVLFETNEKELVLYNGPSYYEYSLYDNLFISNEKIVIEGIRSKRIPLDSVLYNVTSTLYKQILRALTYAFMTTGICFKIATIQLKGNNESHVEQNILQPFTQVLNSKLFITPAHLDVLFSNNSKVDMLLNSIILYIKGIQENNFDYYWKCFNCLYTGISGKDKEFDKLIYMRNFVTNHLSEFTNSFNLIDSDGKDQIRGLRIRDFILNQYPTQQQAKQFKELILRFSDYRLNEVFFETLPYRQSFLQAEGYLTDVLTHINSSISSKQKSNDQLLCFYILKYAYFLRNKYFHAEKSAPVFLLKSNNELTELDKINGIMQMFIYDLLNCNHLYM